MDLNLTPMTTSTVPACRTQQQKQPPPPSLPLFEATRLGPLQLPNRLVMAPLTRNRAQADGVPSDLMVTHYAQRASAGLIIAEGHHSERGRP